MEIAIDRISPITTLLDEVLFQRSIDDMRSAYFQYLKEEGVFHQVWRLTFPAYRAWSDRSSQISAEIADLQRRIATLYE